MNTIEISHKFKDYLNHQNNLNLDSNYLKQLTREYRSQYDQLKEKDAINKFIGNIANYLKFVLSEDGFFDNPYSPQDYLTNLATIGIQNIIVYSGYVPEKFEKKFNETAKKYLIQLFHLKNFNGFDLVFQHDYKISYTTTIKMFWQDNLEQKKRQRNIKPKSKQIVKYNVIQHKDHLNLPLDIISPPVYDPEHPQFEEFVKRDIDKNVQQLKSELQQKYLYHHRRHRHRSPKKDINSTKNEHLKIKNIKKAINQFENDKSNHKVDEIDINKEDNTNAENSEQEESSEQEENSDKNIKNDSGNDGTTSSDYGDIKFVKESDIKEQKKIWTTV